MKTISFVVYFIYTSIIVHAQTTINKTYPISKAQSLDLFFDCPKIIKISSWDKNEIHITGSVEINNGEHDDAFVLTQTESNGIVTIKGEIPNIKTLPQQITIHKNGEKIVFKNKEELTKYKKENGSEGITMTNYGNNVEIVLDIKLPANIKTNIDAKYGMVELKNLKQTSPFTANSTYGGIDATISPSSAGELFVSSDFGEIYSNLSLKFSAEGLKQKDFHKELMAKIGNGPKYSFESKYGNVYMRKP